MLSVLFVIDKLEFKYFEFNKLVTNFWLIKEFLEEGNEVYITTITDLYLQKNKAYTVCYKSYFDKDLFYNQTAQNREINSFDKVFFRPDPPVDINYINATYIFDFVNKPEVINSPRSIRDFNEKLHSLHFYEYMTDSVVTASLKILENFLKQHKQIVLKPLNQCFGTGVMYLYDGDPNTHTIINTMTDNEKTCVMAQEYIPEVKNGDVRILTLGDKVLPYAIKKLPGKDDFKFNNHSDKYIKRYDLSPEELNYYKPVAIKLNKMGIKMAGLDVINSKIIEINVTSPCFFINEINHLFKINLEKQICPALLNENLLYV